LDDWPAAFVAVPRVGEWVRSRNGKVVGRVVGVQHTVDAIGAPSAGAPSIVVELKL
jgi:hypothetical protein